MSEPFLERLSRFTPDAGVLDRDAMLFAAGRNSARPNRRWMALAGVLASTQALSLALLWVPPPHEGGLSVPVATAPSPAALVKPATAAEPADSGLLSVHSDLRDAEIVDRPSESVSLVDSGPPLRALGPVPPSILN
jgi:hypothetical protein